VGFFFGALLTYLFDLKKLKIIRKKEFDLHQVNSLLALLKRLLIVTRGELPAEKEIASDILDEFYAEAALVVSLPSAITSKLDELYSRCLAYNEYLDLLQNRSDTTSLEQGNLKLSDKREEQKRHELENLVKEIVGQIRESYVV